MLRFAGLSEERLRARRLGEELQAGVESRQDSASDVLARCMPFLEGDTPLLSTQALAVLSLCVDCLESGVSAQVNEAGCRALRGLLAAETSEVVMDAMLGLGAKLLATGCHPCLEFTAQFFNSLASLLPTYANKKKVS
jgi:hypothetical protein